MTSYFSLFWEYLPSKDVFYSLTYFQKIEYKSWFDLSIIRQNIVWVAYILIFKNVKLPQKIHRLQDFKSFIPDPSS